MGAIKRALVDDLISVRYDHARQVVKDVEADMVRSEKPKFAKPLSPRRQGSRAAFELISPRH
jgi:hypothetical protein